MDAARGILTGAKGFVNEQVAFLQLHDKLMQPQLHTNSASTVDVVSVL